MLFTKNKSQGGRNHDLHASFDNYNKARIIFSYFLSVIVVLSYPVVQDERGIGKGVGCFFLFLCVFV